MFPSGLLLSDPKRYSEFFWFRMVSLTFFLWIRWDMNLWPRKDTTGLRRHPTDVPREQLFSSLNRPQRFRYPFGCAHRCEFNLYDGSSTGYQILQEYFTRASHSEFWFGMSDNLFRSTEALDIFSHSRRLHITVKVSGSTILINS